MQIGELARRAGVNAQTVRYYERLGLVPPAARTPAGYRIYEEDALERLTFIRSAQRLGIALDEIGEILALRDRRERPCDYVRDVLRRQVDEIDQRIAELRALRHDLVHLDQIAVALPDTGSACCKLIDHVRQRDAET